jgi:predicted transcriptional regulator
MWTGYSGAFKAVKKLLSQELICLDSIEPSEKNSIKKSYIVTEKGRRLLEVFPEKGGVNC